MRKQNKQSIQQKGKTPKYKEPTNRGSKGRNNRTNDSSYKRGANTDSLAKSGADLPKGDRDNDPNWYFTNAELAEQSAELSFQAVLGDEPIIGYDVPTINVIALNPSPGVNYNIPDANPKVYSSTAPSSTDLPTDVSTMNGINLMATKIYTLLSTYTGRTTSYSPDDVAIMLLATSSVAELSEHIRRIFGLAMTYNPRNRSVPKRLIEALGVNFTDLRANIANYRMRFNIAMARINQIPLLDNIGFIRKSREIYQKVYLDDISAMAQIYCYAPFSVWQLDETTLETGSLLRTTRLRSSGIVNLAVLLGRLEAMIDSLLTSNTLNIVYADILNLANKMSVPMWKFDYLAENYTVIPEYDVNFLLQLHNTDIVGQPRIFENEHLVGTTDIKVTNDNDVVANVEDLGVVYNPAFRQGTSTSTWNFVPRLRKKVVDTYTDRPSLVDRIEMLRFKVADGGWWVPTTSATLYAECLKVLPDHWCVECYIYSGQSGLDTIQTNETINVTNVAHLSQCHSHPLMYDVEYDNTKGIHAKSILGELNFFTEVDYSYLQRLTRMIYTGLFDFRV